MIQRILTAALSVVIASGSMNSTTFAAQEKYEINQVAEAAFQNAALDTSVAKESITNERSTRNGMLGRWQIPSVGINVAAFNTSSQKVTDAKDAAACFRRGNVTIIADHVNQSFGTLKKCEVGDVAYFDDGVQKKAYFCTAKFMGHNTETALTDGNYRDVTTANVNGITCYTCTGPDPRNVWILYFQPLNSIYFGR